MTDQELNTRTLAQLHDAIERHAATALGTVQSLIAEALFPDHTFAAVELDLLKIMVAIDRAQQLLHHSVQVLSGLRLPGEDQDTTA